MENLILMGRIFSWRSGRFFVAQASEQIALRIPLQVSIQGRRIKIVGEENQAGFLTTRFDTNVADDLTVVRRDDPSVSATVRTWKK